MSTYMICWIAISNLYHGESALPIIRKSFRPDTNILGELDFHRLILFSTDISALNDDLYRNVLLRVPAVSIDLTRLATNEERKISTFPLVKNSTSSTVYVIFGTEIERGSDLKSMKYTLDVITHWSVISPRPKLLIIYQTLQQVLSENLQSVLAYAWYLEFVDCTILVTTPKNAPVSFTYNPFTRQLVKDSVIAKLFPDKLCNLHGYPIKIPSIELPPYIHVVRNPEGKAIDMIGMSYEYCRILSKTLNFSLAIVPGLENSVVLANFTALFEKLHSKEIDMLPMPFNVRSIMYDFEDMLYTGKLFLDTNYVILVPIEPTVKIDVPLDAIIFILFFFVIICAFKAFRKLFRFPSEHWRANKVFQILLGITVTRKTPKTIVEKIIYMSLVVTSMKYSVDTLTKLMDIKIVKGEVDYNHLSDIADSNLPIYTVSFIIEHVYANTDDAILLKMKSKTRDIRNIYWCVDEMVENKSCMCITPHSAGAYVSKQYVKSDGTPTTKVARPILYNDMAAFGYTRTSPFASKLDSVIQRIVESGISNTWTGTQKYTIKSEDFERRKPIRENIFLQELCALLSLGYLIASITFAVEIVGAKSKRRVAGKCDKNLTADAVSAEWRKLHRRLS